MAMLNNQMVEQQIASRFTFVAFGPEISWVSNTYPS